MKTAEIVACPGCGEEAFQEFAFSSEHRLRRCAICELVFAPAYADPTEVYVDGYLKGATDFGIDVSHPAFQQLLEHAARVRFGLVERVVAPPGRLLDVGCGSGEVLAVARERGWEVQGAEPVAESARIAREERGLDVRAAILEDAGLPKATFDVVSAFHVLEHMTDGVGFLRMIARWAKPGGNVVIEVPNWRSVHRVGSGSSWSALRPLEHVAHYTPFTLAATMRRAGLEPVRVHTPGFLWEGQSIEFALADLGLQRAGPRVRRVRALTRPGELDGEPVTKPSRLGWWLLRTVQGGYGMSRVGVVVLAIARVP